MTSFVRVSRRAFVSGGASIAALGALRPSWARAASAGVTRKGFDTLVGPHIDLTIGRTTFTADGGTGSAVTINGSLPGPLIRLREGDNLHLTVHNELDEETSIHWHGLLLPFHMDGVPGVSFPGIAPRTSFTYQFPVRQAGTYWYHSHSGLQEPVGHYGPLIIDPAGGEPAPYDREHVLVISDWTFADPHMVLARLKQQGGFFNHRKTTLTDRRGVDPATKRMFDRMRMDPTDIADVGAPELLYLINGYSPGENWTGLFHPGERVRLRIINAASITLFNLRIPGLPMTVVAADGLNVKPVEVDELQIGNGETYDVIVTPRQSAYSLVAEATDRTGMAVATLATAAGMRAPVPALRGQPILSMKDMGMAGDHSAHASASPDPGGAMPTPQIHQGHGTMAASEMAAGHEDHVMPVPDSDPAGPAAGHAAMDMRDKSLVDFPVGPGVDMIAPMPTDRTGEPGLGLETVPHRALTYRDLAAVTPAAAKREPDRFITVHLTGNMERYMWSMDGEQLSDKTEPYRFRLGERVRMRLVNDTMMTHPMHLHGHFFEVVNGQGANQPMKHTVRVLPGSFVDIEFTADAPGDWAFHCHLLLHMHMGMMRVVKTRPLAGDGQ